ncbi:MAG TPA: hypothetical protein VG753_03005 [Candidatus Paceibacterota bacterium]|nr:hypothetical protein [Candidatus Paceibacterota bacterium]
MMRHTKRTLIFVVAIVLIVLGIIGLVLPFLQGLLFLAAGAVLLFILFPSLREESHRHTVKYPKVHSFLLKVEDKLREMIGDL